MLIWAKVHPSSWITPQTSLVAIFIFSIVSYEGKTVQKSHILFALGPWRPSQTKQTSGRKVSARYVRENAHPITLNQWCPLSRTWCYLSILDGFEHYTQSQPDVYWVRQLAESTPPLSSPDHFPLFPQAQVTYLNLQWEKEQKVRPHSTEKKSHFIQLCCPNPSLNPSCRKNPRF